jgi:hypothetical protein
MGISAEGKIFMTSLQAREAGTICALSAHLPIIQQLHPRYAGF